MTDQDTKRSAVPTFGAIAEDTWFTSLRRQLKQLAEERKNPRPQLELTAKRDPKALRNLVETPIPFLSLISQVRRPLAY